MLTTAGQTSALPANCVQLESTVTCTFVYTGGEQHFTVPTAVTHMQVEAVGGRGGDAELVPEQSGGRGGLGGTASAPINVFGGETLYIEVAGDGLPNNTGGWNGGANRAIGMWGNRAGTGGGASDVRTVSCGAGCADGGSFGSLVSRLVVAGGGGGGGEVGESEGFYFELPGGDGGAAEGGGGMGSDAEGSEAFGGGGGTAGTLTGGGSGGEEGVAVGGGTSGSEGEGGALGHGGNGAAAYESENGTGGGGGGGYYGGGGGGGGGDDPISSNHASAGGGGGGGSSYAPGGATGLSAEGTPPLVTISYQVPVVDVRLTPLNFATQAQGTLSAPQTLTVTDEGEGPLVLSSLTFTGADPGDFLIGSDGCLGQLEPSESCDITVSFAPQAQGDRAAVLQIASNDPTGPASVPLEGTGSTQAGTSQEGSTGATGPAGPTGATGPAGPTGATGTPGSSSATGTPGPAGPTGPVGPRGQSASSGNLVVMTCRTRATSTHSAGHAHGASPLICSRTESETLALRGGARAAHAQLVRGGHIYAAGMVVQTAHGRAELVLAVRKALTSGPWTLVVAHRQGGHWTTTRRPVTIA
ncbi:MAG TPA: choice-of-anchor D domain-containing protein [Solirubrobacteraceae bacterium]